MLSATGLFSYIISPSAMPWLVVVIASVFRLRLLLRKLGGAVVGAICVIVGNGLTSSVEREYLNDVLYVGLVRGGSGRDAGVYGYDMPAFVEVGECDKEGALLATE